MTVDNKGAVMYSRSKNKYYLLGIYDCFVCQKPLEDLAVVRAGYGFKHSCMRFYCMEHSDTVCKDGYHQQGPDLKMCIVEEDRAGLPEDCILVKLRPYDLANFRDNLSVFEAANISDGSTVVDKTKLAGRVDNMIMPAEMRKELQLHTVGEKDGLKLLEGMKDFKPTKEVKALVKKEEVKR